MFFRYGERRASCLTSMQWEYEVVGTLSGDDTFLILMRTEGQAAAICGRWAAMWQRVNAAAQTV